MFSILDGEGIDDSGAFTSCLQGVSKTTEPTINGESICGVATTSTGSASLSVVPYEPCLGLYRLSEKVMHDVWVKVRSSR